MKRFYQRGKGFTLIELLAVIVILAIIALIAVPIILNMIENARKSAAKSSALGYIDAINYNNELADASSDIEGLSGYTKIADGNDINVSGINVKMKGARPTSGTVNISNGRVSCSIVVYNGYYVKYDGKEATIVDENATCSGNSTPVVSGTIDSCPGCWFAWYGASAGVVFDSTLHPQGIRKVRPEQYRCPANGCRRFDFRSRDSHRHQW